MREDPSRGSALPVSAGDSGQIRGKRAVCPGVDAIELQTIKLLVFLLPIRASFCLFFSFSLWCPTKADGIRAMRQDDSYARNTNQPRLIFLLSHYLSLRLFLCVKVLRSTEILLLCSVCRKLRA